MIGCEHPDEYQASEEKNKGDRLSADLCLINGKTPKHFIRGLLEIPLLLDGADDSPVVLTWSLWVAVSPSDFERVVAGWSRPEVLIVSGTLANNLPTYKDTAGTPATLTTRGSLRPLVTITKSTDNTLMDHHTKGMQKEQLAAALTAVYEAERSR